MMSAIVVLLEPSLLRHVLLFQGGFPEDIVLWARSIRSAYPSKNRGLLPRRAAEQRDLHLLQRLYKLRCEQPRLQSDPSFMSFDGLWQTALLTSSVAVVEWISLQPDLMHDGIKTSDIGYALHSEDRKSMLKWLLTTIPSYKALVSIAHSRGVASYGDVELMQWLEANVPNLPVSYCAMDVAAESGKLEMVKYLHEHRSEGCTTVAMTRAAILGHLEVVKFLHERRSEGLDRRIAFTRAVQNGHASVVEYLHEQGLADGYEVAIRYAAQRGHLSILQYLMTTRPDCYTPFASRNAASEGHLQVVQYLHENYHDRCTREAILDAIAAVKLPVVKYLSEHCEKVDGSALARAALCGDVNAMAYLVTTRTDGCLVKAKAIAEKYKRLEVLTYLREIIDQDMDESHHDTEACQAAKQRTCGKNLSHV